MRDGEEPIYVNVAAYADDLVLYCSTRDGIDSMLTVLADFCDYADMKVNVRKCVSVSQTWQAGRLEDQTKPFEFRARWAAPQHPIVGKIPVESVSVYLGLSMKVRITRLGQSNLNIMQ
jgi:hypothetical protein